MPNEYTAGGGNKLGIVRHGRDLMEQFERIATTADVFPGDAVEVTTDGNGDPAFQPHTGTAAVDYYVAVEARGRGMDAQTDTGYVADNDMAKAVRPNGGGLHLTLAAGENVSEGDALVVGSGGEHTAYVSADDDRDDIVAYADEDLDLSGATDAGLVAAEME